MAARVDMSAIEERIGLAMLADQRRLRARLRDVGRAAREERPARRHPALRYRPRPAGGPGGAASGAAEAELERLAEEVERSVARREARAASAPRVEYPAELPVSQRREEIARAIAAHQVVVVCGETGSGKTTQLPKVCLELGRGVAGMIGHTQPRRIAARTVATRVAQELGTSIGGLVGYKVRFGDRTSAQTLVKVMTDGVLLAETQHDRLLEQYDTLIVDEAHERSLNIDFLLGMLRRLLPRRPELKVVITSATIDPERFARHFSARALGTGEAELAPVVEVSGRTHPVEVVHRAPVVEGEELDAEDLEAGMEPAIVRAVDELVARHNADRSGGPGNVLVFLPGEREIREVAEALRKHHFQGDARRHHETEIVPLYARLSAEEQLRAFQPLPAGARRRIVLATNVAETSLTVPGIRYVVDPGLARISRYSSRRRVQSLPIEPVSQASARQRAGRCGRVADGVCVRLYSAEDYNARPAFTDPEILRTNLAAVVLQMKFLRLGDPAQFPFIDPPDARLLHDAVETLRELGALDERGELTRLGNEIARLPIDPRLGRIVVEADREGALGEALVIAAALSVQDPRLRPAEEQGRADALHARFRDERSDFAALLKLWRYYHEQARKLSGSKLRKLCRDELISFVRMREWVDVHHQLKALVTEMGRRVSEKEAEHDALHRALLSGLLDSVGKLAEQTEYQGARGLRFNLFPGSGLYKERPRWIMAAELVKTTKLYARTAARIEPSWIVRVGGRLIKKTWSDPRWNAQRGLVEASERATLHGLEIYSGRRVHYGPIDPKVSRELFIQFGLVEGELRTDAPFFLHNRALIARVKEMESRARRRDLLADPRALYAFFDARAPEGVFSLGALEAWRKTAERENPRVLFLSERDVLAGDADAASAERFPDAMEVEGADGARARFALAYVFEGGSPSDGVTATVPLLELGLLTDRRAEWLVAGLVPEKIEALIKGLSKEVRRGLVPAGEFAARAAAELRFGQGDFYEESARAVERLGSTTIPREEWRGAELPEHLRLNVRVVDETGAELAQGRDLGELRRGLASATARRLEQVPDPRWRRDSVTEWDFGDLPEETTLDAGGVRLRAHPAVVAQGSTAALRLFASRDLAAHETVRGVRRLLFLAMRRQILFMVDEKDAARRLALLYATVGTGAELRLELGELIAGRACLADEAVVRTKKEFEERLERGWNGLTESTGACVKLAQAILEARQRVELRLSGRLPEHWSATYADAGEQLERLAGPGFLLATPWFWLQQLPRLLRGIELRLERLPSGGGAKEERRMAEVLPYWRACLEMQARHAERGEFDPGLEELRWAIEEFRVSLFAQELGTSMPVSLKKIEQLWRKVRA